ncbi:MAG: hypothetical protein ABSA84_02535 [Gammaproteobacteria bacterium]|jgi:hypothetical protein
MKPFKLIQGNNNNIDKFEDEIAQAMENGYEFSSEMIVKVVEHANGPIDVLFFQPMTIEEHLDFDDDNLDYSHNEEEEEEEPEI